MGWEIVVGIAPGLTLLWLALVAVLYVVARREGDPTAWREGRRTGDPGPALARQAPGARRAQATHSRPRLTQETVDRTGTGTCAACPLPRRSRWRLTG